MWKESVYWSGNWDWHERRTASFQIAFLAFVLCVWCADIAAMWNVCRQLASIPSHLCCLWFPSPLCFMSVHQIWSLLISTGTLGWRHPELGGAGGAFWWTGKGLFYLMGAATAANLGDDWVMKERVRQELFLLASRGFAELDEKWDWVKAAIRCAENSQRSWVSLQLEAQWTSCLWLWLGVYLHKMSWMSYLAVSDFAACPDPICSRDKMLYSWRHLQWQQGRETKSIGKGSGAFLK